MEKLPERIAKRLVYQPFSGCWLWAGVLDRNGYGRCAPLSRGGMVYVHRIVFQEMVGLIPPGLEPDHLCRVRRCANPSHMELVTHRENTLRGNTLAADEITRTHCPAGHEYTSDNTYTSDRRHRTCRACRRVRQSAYKARLRQRVASIVMRPSGRSEH